MRQVRATRYVTPLREGGSLPGIVEADDLGTYVCKFRGAGQGLRVLVAEVLVGELALERCHTDAAPWYVVPSDHKWYRNWAVGQLLLEAFHGMDLEWPEPGYDVAEQRARLEAEGDDEESSSS